jgi:hypothetical protein
MTRFTVDFFEERAIIRIFVMMSTLTIHPVDMDQETAIKMFLDALHVSYSASRKDMDETDYLSASPAMKEHLDKAARQEKNGEGVKITLDDIWK